MMNKLDKFIFIAFIILTLLFVGCDLGTSTENHKLLINNETYYLRATVGGIGGTFVYSIGQKKRNGWKFDKDKEIHLRTHNLKPCYFKVKNDTLYFFSSEKLIVPNSMKGFPLKQYSIKDTINFDALTLVHTYSKGF